MKSDLFDEESRETAPADESAGAPLADRMRPKDLSEYVGQEHILGPGKPLRRMIEKGELHSMILWDRRAPARPRWPC